MLLNHPSGNQEGIRGWKTSARRSRSILLATPGRLFFFNIDRKGSKLLRNRTSGNASAAAVRPDCCSTTESSAGIWGAPRLDTSPKGTGAAAEIQKWMGSASSGGMRDRREVTMCA